MVAKLTGGYRTLSFREGDLYYITPEHSIYSITQYNYLIALVDTPAFPVLPAEETVTNYAVVCCELNHNNKYAYVGLGDYEKERLGEDLVKAIEQGYKPNTWVHLIVYHEEKEVITDYDRT